MVWFWTKTLILYGATALLALLVCLGVSLALVRAVAGPAGDSPALGMMWVLLFAGLSSLLLPLCLGLTAQAVQDKVLSRRFNWGKGLVRFLLALPISCGTIYTWWVLLMLRDDARPLHWLAKVVLLDSVSLGLAYLALRIRKQLPETSTAAVHQ